VVCESVSIMGYWLLAIGYGQSQKRVIPSVARVISSPPDPSLRSG
jgi:hypothetical protein